MAYKFMILIFVSLSRPPIYYLLVLSTTTVLSYCQTPTLRVAVSQLVILPNNSLTISRFQLAEFAG
jgi:hypothetical protein